MNFRKMLTTVDAHTEGNPERVVIGGVPPTPGKTMLEKVKYVRNNRDYLRTLLVHEPRGHSNMYASLLKKTNHSQKDNIKTYSLEQSFSF